ncbi:hypothetical protein [Streptomyces sp. DSM 118878]
MDDSRTAGTAGMTPAARAAKTVVDELGVGALVIDENRQRLGRVVGNYGAYVMCRPPAGGLEWDALPKDVRPARPDEILCVPTTVRERTP